MAVTTTFINDSKAHDAREFTDYFARFVSDGVFAEPANALQVSVEGMTVKVKAGAGFVRGVMIANNSDLSLTIDTTASARIDRVVMGVDQSAPSAGIYVLKGTDGTTTAPELANTTSKRELCLAEIMVTPNGVSSCSDTRLTNLCGVVRNLLGTIDASGLFASYQTEFEKVIAQGKAAASSAATDVQEIKDQAQAAFSGFIGGMYSNAIINGGFDIDQRGGGAVHSLVSGQRYTLDRWLARIDGATDGIASVQRYRASDGKNVLRINNKPMSGNGMLSIGQFIEGGAAAFGGGKVTVAFRAKAATAQKAAIGFQIRYTASNVANIGYATFDLTTDYDTYSATFDVPAAVCDDTNNAKVTVFTAWSGTTANESFGTSSDNGLDTQIYISDFVVCRGENAMPYSPQPIADELERCRRYYRKTGLTTLACGIMKADKTVKTQAVDFSGMRNAPAITVTDQAGNSGKASVELTTTGIEDGHAATATSNTDGNIVSFVIHPATSAQVQPASILFGSIEADSEVYA